MADEIKAGDRLEISRDISVGGRLAFEEGQLVTVDKVDPNPDRPQYRYVVRSPALGKRLQLRAEDLRPTGEAEEYLLPGEAAGAPGGKKPVTGAPAGAAPARAPGFLRRHKWLVIGVVALLVAAGIAVALVLLLANEGANETLTEKTRELRSVVQSAGASSTSLSSEISNAIRQAPTPDKFAPLGKSIASKYIPSFQEYSSRISTIRADVAQVKPSPSIEYSRSRLLAACDAYGKAMLGYVTALEQLSKSQVAQATQTLLDVKRLIDTGNSLIGT